MRFFGVLLMLIGLPFCIVPFIGVPMIIIGLFMVIAGFGSSNANKTAKALAKQIGTMPPPAPVSSGDADKWAALSRYDDDVRAAVEKLKPYGADAIAKLRTTYLALNDKTKLPHMIEDIQAEFKKSRR